jgi:hypothetical protein
MKITRARVVFGALGALHGCKPSQDSAAQAAPARASSSASPAASAVAPTQPAHPAAPPPATVADSGKAGNVRVVTFDGDAVGAPSPAFEAVVGEWYVAEDGGARGLRVDGTRWRQGTPSVNLADQAKRLYGDRYAEFLDGVKAFAFFPLAVHQGPDISGDYRLSVRFFPENGRIDQAAGIAFAIAPDGSYLMARANALEDNILFCKVYRGKRTILDNVRNTPTPTKTWHTLSVTVRGRDMHIDLDGTERFAKRLEAPPSGRVGLWSKADSQVLFDDFVVEAL